MGRLSWANVRKTLYYLKRNGVTSTWYAAKERMEEAKIEPYRYVAPAGQELERQRAEGVGQKEIISIVVPTYRTAERYLREMIESVLQQTYSGWELILADATEDDSVRAVVKTYADERIRYIRLPDNAGIAENTNRALEYATGAYIGLLDHDDMLTEDALYETAVRIAEGARLIYSDEDKCNGDGTQYYEPNLKEDFNLDLLLSNNYICHFMVMESTLIKEMGFRPEYDGAQDYDLVLRAAERLMEHEEWIAHIPRVLYHWRCHTASTAENPMSKQYAYEAGLRAVQDFSDRQGWNAKACHLRHLGFYQLRYDAEPFQSRKDLGAIGGRIIIKGKVAGGRLTNQGILLYEGLPKTYSGYLHRAVLPQDADAVDIRCIRIRKECIPLFEKITGVSYCEISGCEVSGNAVFDADILPAGTDYRKISIVLGKALREAGYRILYLPSMTVKVRQEKT